jgi:hypothetical protein
MAHKEIQRGKELMKESSKDRQRNAKPSENKFREGNNEK